MLSVLIGIGLAAGTMLLVWGWSRSPRARMILDIAGIAAFFLFFVLTARAVIRTLADGTVFMTHVHEILLQPLFLICGAYLGPYVLTKIWLQLRERYKSGQA